MKPPKKSQWALLQITAAAVAGAGAAVQLVMTAAGIAPDATTVTVLAATVICLAGLYVDAAFPRRYRMDALEQWGDALNRRHVLLDSREHRLNELEQSLTWWKGTLS